MRLETSVKVKSANQMEANLLCSLLRGRDSVDESRSVSPMQGDEQLDSLPLFELHLAQESRCPQCDSLRHTSELQFYYHPIWSLVRANFDSIGRRLMVE